MAHTRRTLLLDRKKWDLTLNGSGRIAVTRDDYATAQSVANEARLFTADAYFIQDQGIPHFTVELGRRVNNAVLRSYLRRAALRVPDVKEVLSVRLNPLGDVDAQGDGRPDILKARTLSGDILFRTVEGEQHGAIRTDF